MDKKSKKIQQIINEDKLFVTDIKLRKAPLVPTIGVTHSGVIYADDKTGIEMIGQEADVEWIKKNTDEVILDGKVTYVVYMDIKGSQFYDKIDYTKGEKKKESMSVKIARSLGILHDKRWIKIIKYINRDDKNGSTDYTDIATIGKFGQLQDPSLSLAIAKWFFKGLYVKLYYDNRSGDFTIGHIREVIQKNEKLSQEIDPDTWYEYGWQIYRKHKEESLQNAINELDKRIKNGQVMRKAIVHKGQKMYVMAMETNEYRIKTAINYRKRDKEYGYADIRVLKSNNIIRISYNKRFQVDFEEVLAVIRYFEWKKKNPHYEKKWNPELLRRKGELKGVREWVYIVETDEIINSISHGADLSQLSLTELMFCVQIALHDNFYLPILQIAGSCQRGNCILGEHCYNMMMGLPKCLKNYREQKKLARKRAMRKIYPVSLADILKRRERIKRGGGNKSA